MIIKLDENGCYDLLDYEAMQINRMRKQTQEDERNMSDTKELKDMAEEVIKSFIRETLTIDGKRLRFDMSGQAKASDIHHILNKFEYLGIYDYTYYLTLRFYKGTPQIFYLYWHGNHEDETYGGLTTTEIIYKIFKLTILSDNRKRKTLNSVEVEKDKHSIKF